MKRRNFLKWIIAAPVAIYAGFTAGKQLAWTGEIVTNIRTPEELVNFLYYETSKDGKVLVHSGYDTLWIDPKDLEARKAV